MEQVLLVFLVFIRPMYSQQTPHLRCLLRKHALASVGLALDTANSIVLKVLYAGSSTGLDGPVSADAPLLCALSGRYLLAIWPCVHACWLHVHGLCARYRALAVRVRLLE